VFGEAKDGKMPMQAYARYLKAHNAPPQAVVTTMYFDENSDVPKLFFKAARPLNESELAEVIDLRSHDDVTRALTMTVSQSDGVKGGAPKAEPKKSNNVLASDEPVEEPKKVAKKEEVKASNDDLGALVDDWDDV